jgi:hypothetical protein
MPRARCISGWSPASSDKLTALRGKDESYSDVILRLARGDAGAKR